MKLGYSLLVAAEAMHGGETNAGSLISSNNCCNRIWVTLYTFGVF